VHVEVEYTIYNKASVNRDIWLMLKVLGSNNQLLTSAMYQIRLKARTRKPMIKILDKFIIPIDDEIKPVRATIEVYKRKVLS